MCVGSTVWSPAEGAKEYCKLRTQVHSCSTPFCLFISLNFTFPTRKRQESWLAGRGTVGSQGIMGMAHLAKWAESGVKKANVSGICADSHQPWWESQSFFLMSDPNSSFCASDGLPQKHPCFSSGCFSPSSASRFLTSAHSRPWGASKGGVRMNTLPKQ